MLLTSFLRAVPGLPALCAVGLLCVLAGRLAPDARQGTAWSLAAISFLVAAPALFAGPHFRDLAARRSHLLLPDFATRLWCSALLLFLLAALTSALLAPGLQVSQRGALGVLALAGWSALFWFGFLPSLLRMLLGFVLLALLAAAGPAALLASPGDVTELTWPAGLLCLLGWGWMLIWLQRRCARGQVFVRSQGQRWNLPAALFASKAEHLGTPVGTLLLGQSDGAGLRWQRAVLGVLLIPLLLWTLLQLAAADQALGLPDNAVLAFLALTYALALYTQLCLQAAARRPLLWLRSDCDWPGLHGLAERLLWREWWPLAACWLVLWLLAWQVHDQPPLRLAHLGLAWLLGLLLNLYLCLLAAHRPAWLKAGLAAHLLALVLALAAERIEAADHALLWLAASQLLLIIGLRQWGRLLAARGAQPG